MKTVHFSKKAKGITVRAIASCLLIVLASSILLMTAAAAKSRTENVLATISQSYEPETELVVEVSKPTPEPTVEPEVVDERPREQWITCEAIVPSLAEETEGHRPSWQDVATEEEVIRIAKTVASEAGGIWNQLEQKSVVWCICNRCDRWGKSISEVCVSGQFAYYSWQSTTDGFGRDMISLVEEVLTEWAMEKAGCDCERTLPADYIYFYGDGSHNWFSNSYPVNGGILYD